MIGHQNRRFRSLAKRTTDNENDDFHSPFMYGQDSCRDLEHLISTGPAYRRTSTFDTAGTSDSKDSMDELEKALLKHDARVRKEKKAKKKKLRRRTQSLPEQASTGGTMRRTQSTPTVQPLSLAEAESEPSANNESIATEPSGMDASSKSIQRMPRIGSNVSLTSLNLPSPKETLQTSFGDATWITKPGFSWDGYFQPSDDKADMTRDLHRAISSRKVKYLRKFWKQGVSMNARNKQGESVVQLVCREGCVEQLVFLMVEAKVSVRVRDHTNKHALHEVAWSPQFNPSIAMMLISDSPELLWAPDFRGFLALDYVPKRALRDWYNFLGHKQPIIRLALEFSRWQDSCKQLNNNQLRLQSLLDKHSRKST